MDARPISEEEEAASTKLFREQSRQNSRWLDACLSPYRPAGRSLLDQKPNEDQCRQYDAIAKSSLLRSTRSSADQIIEQYRITSGPALISVAAQAPSGRHCRARTDLYLLFFDQSEEMLELCERTIDENGLRAGPDCCRATLAPSPCRRLRGSNHQAVDRSSSGTITPRPFAKFTGFWRRRQRPSSAAVSAVRRSRNRSVAKWPTATRARTSLAKRCGQTLGRRCAVVSKKASSRRQSIRSRSCRMRKSACGSGCTNQQSATIRHVAPKGGKNETVLH